jgi:hypothetical protein
MINSSTMNRFIWVSLYSMLLIKINHISFCNCSLFHPTEYDVEEEEGYYKRLLRGNIISSDTKQINSAPLPVLNYSGNCKSQDRPCQLCEGHCEIDSDCADGK